MGKEGGRLVRFWWSIAVKGGVGLGVGRNIDVLM